MVDIVVSVKCRVLDYGILTTAMFTISPTTYIHAQLDSSASWCRKQRRP